MAQTADDRDKASKDSRKAARHRIARHDRKVARRRGAGPVRGLRVAHIEVALGRIIGTIRTAVG